MGVGSPSVPKGRRVCIGCKEEKHHVAFFTGETRCRRCVKQFGSTWSDLGFEHFLGRMFGPSLMLEKERLEKERLEQERLEQERLEQERLEQERLEQERLEQERLEQERLEQERLEKERLEQERLEKIRLSLCLRCNEPMQDGDRSSLGLICKTCIYNPVSI